MFREFSVIVISLFAHPLLKKMEHSTNINNKVIDLIWTIWFDFYYTPESNCFIVYFPFAKKHQRDKPLEQLENF